MFRKWSSLPESFATILFVLGMTSLYCVAGITFYLESRASAREKIQAPVHPAYTTTEVTGLRELAKTFLEKRESFEFWSLKFWLSFEELAKPKKKSFDAALDRWLEANRLRIVSLPELREKAWKDAVQAGEKEFLKWRYIACLLWPTLLDRAAQTKTIEVYVNTVTGLVLATAPERIPPYSGS